MEYYHIFTKGLEKGLLFHDNEEFIYGMNLIPRCLKSADVRALAFCLMDNHVHFVLEGPMEKCKQFMTSYKRALLSFLNKWRKRNLSETMCPGIVRIDNTDNLLTVIAYVLRNPMAAGINYLPQDYLWSSASAYFRLGGATLDDGCRRISILSFREKKKYFKSNCEYPSLWTVDKNGMILPENYVEVKEVEKLFFSVKRYLHRLAANKEMEINLTMMQNLRLNDSELRKEAAKICMDTFGTPSVDILDYHQKLQICKILRRKLGAGSKQLGRIMNLDPVNIKNLL